MKSILTELCDSEAVPENCAVDIVHLMSLNSHDLSSNNLAELVQLCLSFIQKGKNLKGKLVFQNSIKLIYSFFLNQLSFF